MKDLKNILNNPTKQNTTEFKTFLKKVYEEKMRPLRKAREEFKEIKESNYSKPILNTIISEHLKNNPGTDKNSRPAVGYGHSYGEVYDEFLGDYLDKEFTLLEIGVWTGACIRCWLDLFPKAKIYGVDISDMWKEERFLSKYKIENEERFHFVLGDVCDKKNEIKDTFDVIIDDGSHRIEDVEKALDIYFPKLKKGGYYIIEDIQSDVVWRKRVLNKINKESLMVCRDLRKKWNSGNDDIMYVIEKR